MKKAKAEAEISIDFPTKSDAEAMVHALAPETVAPHTSRAFVRVTRRGKAARIMFYSRDLIALRAMLNSYLRFASTWRRIAEALSSSHSRLTRAQTVQT